MSDMICSVPGGGSVQLLDNNYSDLTFVNAARVSFANRSEKFEDRDRKLLKYLATHDHWTPFAHALLCFKLNITDSDLLRFLVDNQQYQFRCESSEFRNEWYVIGSFYAWVKCRYNKSLFEYKTEIHYHLGSMYPESYYALTNEDPSRWNLHRPNLHIVMPVNNREIESHYNINVGKLHPITMIITAPIAIRTQLFKSKIGFVENEISRRYVSYEPDIYNPADWEGFRGKPNGSAKQGSDNSIVCGKSLEYESSVESSVNVYNELIKWGVCAEQARFVLPQGAFTSWWWTGYIDSFARVYRLRSDPHAQKETQKYAECMDILLSKHYKSLWKEVKELHGV